MTEYDNNIKTPVGRLGEGSFTNPKGKDYYGKPTKPYFWAHVAFQKNSKEFNDLHNQIRQVAETGFPELFKTTPNPPYFAWKIIDGDSTIPNKKGSIYAEKEGFPGNYILKFKTIFALKVFDRELNDVTENEDYIKLGDFVRIIGTVSSNRNTDNPGVYLNMNKIQHAGYGKAIITNTGEDFDKAPEQLPDGASLTPLNPLNSPSHENVQQPINNVNVAPPPPQKSAIQPANDILDKKYLIDGNIYTESQLKSNGWDDETLSRLKLAN